MIRCLLGKRTLGLALVWRLPILILPRDAVTPRAAAA